MGTFSGPSAPTSASPHGADAIRAVFPSHIEEFYEALTQRHGQFGADCAVVEARLAQGERVVIEHPVSNFNLRALPDFVRFVDDRFRAAAGIVFTRDAADPPAETDLAPFWQGAVDACRQREVAYTCEPPDALPGGPGPGLRPAGVARPEWRGLTPVSSPRGDTATVAVAALSDHGGRVMDRLSAALDDGSDLPRVIVLDLSGGTAAFAGNAGDVGALFDGLIGLRIEALRLIARADRDDPAFCTVLHRAASLDIPVILQPVGALGAPDFLEWARDLHVRAVRLRLDAGADPTDPAHGSRQGWAEAATALGLRLELETVLSPGTDVAAALNAPELGVRTLGAAEWHIRPPWQNEPNGGNVAPEAIAASATAFGAWLETWTGTAGAAGAVTVVPTCLPGLLGTLAAMAQRRARGVELRPEAICPWASGRTAYIDAAGTLSFCPARPEFGVALRTYGFDLRAAWAGLPHHAYVRQRPANPELCLGCADVATCSRCLARDPEPPVGAALTAERLAALTPCVGRSDRATLVVVDLAGGAPPAAVLAGLAESLARHGESPTLALRDAPPGAPPNTPAAERLQQAGALRFGRFSARLSAAGRAASPDTRAAIDAWCREQGIERADLDAGPHPDGATEPCAPPAAAGRALHFPRVVSLFRAGPDRPQAAQQSVFALQPARLAAAHIAAAAAAPGDPFAVAGTVERLAALPSRHFETAGLVEISTQAHDGSWLACNQAFHVHRFFAWGAGRDGDLCLAATDPAPLDRVLAELHGAPAPLPADAARPANLCLRGIERTCTTRPTLTAPAHPAETPVVLNAERCASHGQCAAACPTDCIRLVAADAGSPPHPVIDAAKCLRCYACVDACPTGALRPGGLLPGHLEPVALAMKPAGWLAALGQAETAPRAAAPTLGRPPGRRGQPLTILGLAMTTQQHHGAALIRDGQILGAVEEERFRRRKQFGYFPPGRPGVTVVADPALPLEVAFPWRSIAWLLESNGLTLDDVDHIAVNGIPARFDRSYSLLARARPPQTLRSGRYVFVPHHLAHAASAYRVSGMRDAFVFTVDGRGERETAAFFETDGAALVRTADLLVERDSLIGGVYETITRILGFGPFGQGSTMALAALGGPGLDLSACLAAQDFRHHRIHEQTAARVFREFTRKPTEKIQERHIQLAAGVQAAVEAVIVNLITAGLAGRPAKNLCLAGGVALNCKTNTRVLEHFGVENLFIQPAAHDAGTALGAALEAHFVITGEAPRPVMTHGLWGPEYPEERMASAIRQFGVPASRSSDISRDVAERVAAGRVVCWYQGRLEFGPRALGARSIVADPRVRELGARMNWAKGRQWWRPFGPSVMAGRESEYFHLGLPMPFMLLTTHVHPEKRERIPVVVHHDGTTRPQSVARADQPLYYDLIAHFERLTGIPMVVNTSFNTAFEPIVNTPEEAIVSFLHLGGDALALGPFLVERPESSRRVRAAGA